MELFKNTVQTTQIIVPNNKIREVQSKFQDKLLNIQKFKPCKPIEGDNQRKMLIFKRIDKNHPKLKQLVDSEESIEASEGEL